MSWQEINAALGQVLLLLSSISFASTSIVLLPMGSFSKITKAGDHRIQYNLYTDDSFSLLPKRNFNLAMLSLLRYTQELGLSVGQTDPVLQFPYKVYEHTINNTVVVYANDAAWTRAMKFILTDLKWLIAWVVKHAAS